MVEVIYDIFLSSFRQFFVLHFLMQRVLRRRDEFLLLSRDSFQPFIEKNICSPNSFLMQREEHCTVLGKAAQAALSGRAKQAAQSSTERLADSGVLRDTDLWTFLSTDFSQEFLSS